MYNMADPATIATITAIGSFLGGAGAVVGAFSGPDQPSGPAPAPTSPTVKSAVPETPERNVEEAQRTSSDRRRQRLRAVANTGGTKSTQLTGSQGITSDEETSQSSGRSRKTILGR